MPKPGVDPSSGISLGDVLRLPKRHPACRRREPQLGSRTERENLAGDAKGKGASGSNREAESTDAPERGGLPRSSDEAGVMLVERRGRVIDIGSGQLRSGDRPQEEPDEQWKAAAFARWHEPDESRGSRPESVRGSGGNSLGLLGPNVDFDPSELRPLFPRWRPNSGHPAGSQKGQLARLDFY